VANQDKNGKYPTGKVVNPEKRCMGSYSFSNLQKLSTKTKTSPEK